MKITNCAMIWGSFLRFCLGLLIFNTHPDWELYWKAESHCYAFGTSKLFSNSHCKQYAKKTICRIWCMLEFT